MRRGPLLASFIAVLACAPGPRNRARFANENVAWLVNDRRDVPVKPASRRFDHVAYVFQNTAHRPIDDLLAVRAPRRAANVNALDEVPDSTWFTNRIGVRDMGVAEIRRGPNRDDGPDPTTPWQIRRTKAGGASPGFLVEDGRGIRYVMKFDRPSRPEMETGADVVVQRLLWAAGYNVPENAVVYFSRDRLVVGDDAVKEDSIGTEVPLTEADVDDVLARSYRNERGEYRALASKFVPGEPLGGAPQSGRRPDDPNDLVPHELMRELRGLYVFAAWLGHSDMKEDNMLDTWIEDEELGRRYVVHYLLDFGKALGVMAWTNRELHDGHAHNFDYRHLTLSLTALGLWERPWEDIDAPGIRGVGVFEGAGFHPGRFRARNRFVPFRRKDPFDAFWATKILMRFTPELIRAAVEQGRYTDAAAIEHLTRALIERQYATGRYWLSRVNPLDGFQVEPEGSTYEVCAKDLLLVHDLAPEVVGATRYVLQSYDASGTAMPWRRSVPARPDGLVCASGLRPSADHDAYTIVSFRTRRSRKPLDPVFVHLAAHPRTGRLRVIGIDRK
jgi:hypothetical protein